MNYMQSSLQNLAFNITGIDIRNSIILLLESGLFANVLPSSLKIDSEEQPAKQDWLSSQLPGAEQGVIIRWDEKYKQEMRFYPGEPQRIWVSLEKEVPFSLLLSTLENTPFALASFDTLYPEWEDLDPDYIAPSFGNGHYPHGWACAIKGQEGHDQLVSRRWLTDGLWEIRNEKNDLSFILFHSLQADAATALQQARPGHEHMGISDEGGFIQDNYIFDHSIKGRYNPDTRLLKVIVHGTELSPRLLLDYSAARRWQTLGKESPLERIAFIFMESEQAEQYLETLWLRGLESYVIEEGAEVRLDENFTPPPKKKPW
jgi:hypothetical protein